MADSELQVMLRVEELLRHIVKLHASAILQAELQGEFEKKLYELTGSVKREDILKKLKCSPNRISETWSRWEQLGLLVKDGKSYRKVA